jgi:hypothetical protein
MATTLQHLMSALLRDARTNRAEDSLVSLIHLKHAVDLLAAGQGDFRDAALRAKDRLAQFERSPEASALTIQDLSIPADELEASDDEGARPQRAIDFYASLFAGADGTKLSKQRLTRLLRQLNAALIADAKQHVQVTQSPAPKEGQAKAIKGVIVNLQKLDRVGGWGALQSQTTDERGKAEFDVTDSDALLPLFRWSVEDPRDKTILWAAAKSCVLAELPAEIALEAFAYQPDSEYEMNLGPFQSFAKNFGNRTDAEKQWVLDQAAAGNSAKLAAFIAMYWADKLKDIKQIDKKDRGRLPVFKGSGDVPDHAQEY